MPVEFGLWRVGDGTVEQVPASAIASEEKLEAVVEQQPEILGLGSLLIVGRQVRTEFGKRIDLLAIDAEGDLYVIELKKDRTPREVVAQALEYGFWVDPLDFEEIREIYAEHHEGEDFDSAFTSHFEAEIPEVVNVSHQLVVVATGMDLSTEQIIDYIRGFAVPINVLFFQYLEDDGREYLARSWLADPAFETASGGAKKKQAPWNGVDFFVAVGESDERRWDDMVRFGFVSAGHGEKYRKAMENLFVGARVWAAIPKSRATGGAYGYVGVGRVTSTAVEVKGFGVEVGGVTTNILEAPGLKAPNMGWDADDPELCEYLVRVEWLDTRSREDAIWEKGMFANQNVVAKLRQPFTLQRLSEVFDPTEE